MDEHVTDAPGAEALGNVANVLHAAAVRAPNDAALIGHWGSRSWAELDAAVNFGVTALASTPSIGHGDRVVIALSNGLELAAALFATLRAGLVAVPVDPTRTDIRWVALRVGARVVVADCASVGDRPPGAAVLSPSRIGEWWRGTTTTYDDSLGHAAGEDLALLARGSRTGPPVMLSHRAILAAARAVAGAKPVALRNSDRVLQVLPMFHVVGLVTAFLPAALAGAAVVVPDDTEAAGRVAAAVAAVRAHRVSVLPAEPTLYRQLDRVDGFERGLGTVRLMTSGSSPLDPADFAAIRAATGQSVREGYGISEAAGAIASTLMAAVARPGSAGLPYPGVEIRIVGGADESDEFERPRGEAGIEDDVSLHSHEDADEIATGAVGVDETAGGSDDAARPAGAGAVGDSADAAGDANGAAGAAAGEVAAANAGKAGAAGAAGAASGNDDRVAAAGVAGQVSGGTHAHGSADDGVAMLEGITDLIEVTGPGGEVGRIAIRGDTLFSGYWPDGSDGPDADGWFLTGDIGYLDDAGELHLVDRATETITVAGFTVYPREVEDVLVGHPLIADAAVVAIPGRGGQSVVAALVAKPGTRPTADDVSEYVVGAGVAPFKRPTDYLVVDALPRTEVGRLDRTAVRHMFAAARGVTLPGPHSDQPPVKKPIPLWRRLPGTSRATGGVRRGAHDTDDDLF